MLGAYFILVFGFNQLLSAIFYAVHGQPQWYSRLVCAAACLAVFEIIKQLDKLNKSRKG